MAWGAVPRAQATAEAVPRPVNLYQQRLVRVFETLGHG